MSTGGVLKRPDSSALWQQLCWVNYSLLDEQHLPRPTEEALRDERRCQVSVRVSATPHFPSSSGRSAQKPPAMWAKGKAGAHGLTSSFWTFSSLGENCSNRRSMSVRPSFFCLSLQTCRTCSFFTFIKLSEFQPHSFRNWVFIFKKYLSNNDRRRWKKYWLPSNFQHTLQSFKCCFF